MVGALEDTVFDLVDLLHKSHVVKEIVKSRKSACCHEAILTSEEDFDKVCESMQKDRGGIVYDCRMPEIFTELYVVNGEVQKDVRGFPMYRKVKRIVETFQFKDAMVDFIPSTKKLSIRFLWKEDAKGFKL